jgi:hypothetical protein
VLVQLLQLAAAMVPVVAIVVLAAAMAVAVAAAEAVADVEAAEAAEVAADPDLADCTESVDLQSAETQILHGNQLEQEEEQ